MPLSKGEVLHNRYRIAKLLGEGGFGAVYRAWDLRLERAIALKENFDTSPDSSTQFKLEAKILSELRHPNLPQVTDYFLIPGKGQYLVMDLIEGEDLQQMLDRQGYPLPEVDVIIWMSQVCDALQYMHSQSPPVIHRDIKPANIKVTPQGKAVLVDFGIAKVYQANRDTTLGARAVTPGYSPQEQYGRGTTDPRSDIYSLGATMYTALTGVEPPESVQRSLGKEFAPPGKLNIKLSSQAEQPILKAMQILPANRFQSAADFKSALLASINKPVQPAPVQAQPLPSPVPAPAGQPSGQAPPASAAPPQASGGRLSFWAVVGLVVLGIACILSAIWLYGAISSDLAANAAAQTSQALMALPTDTRRPTITRREESTSTTKPSVLATHTPVSPAVTESPSATNTPKRTLNATAASLDATPTLDDRYARLSDRDGMLQVYVQAGDFLMGASAADTQALANEKPQHQVYLNAFWIDQTEITNAMYALCVQDGACTHPAGSSSFSDARYERYPVVNITWSQARSYCKWAGRRLPKEAEWEKAARGDNGWYYPWGDEPPDGEYLNYCDTNCRDSQKDTKSDDGYDEAAPVGSYPAGASPYNALDMAGNILEWVEDWYFASFYTWSPGENPLGPSSGSDRVVRGSNWSSLIQDLRITLRSFFAPNTYRDFLGFRCAQ